MRHLLPVVIFAVFSALPLRADEPKIREFDLKTIEALGKELYQRDHLASEGSDLLLAQHPEAQRQPGIPRQRKGRGQRVRPGPFSRDPVLRAVDAPARGLRQTSRISRRKQIQTQAQRQLRTGK